MDWPNHLLKKHKDRQLYEVLSDIRVIKCDLPNYPWSGVLRSDKNGTPLIELETKGRFLHLGMNGRAGVVVPDDGYFTIQGQIESGEFFSAERVYPTDATINPLEGIKIEFQPYELKFTGNSADSNQTPGIIGYINGFRAKWACRPFSSPPADSPFEPAMNRKSWFILRNERITIALGQDIGGTRELAVWSTNHATDIRQAANDFLSALSFYVGEHVTWICFDDRSEATPCWKFRMIPRQRSPLAHRIHFNSIEDKHEESLLKKAFDYFSSPKNSLIVKYILTLLDTSDNIFDIQALTTTVVVEGIATHILEDSEVIDDLKLHRDSIARDVSKFLRDHFKPPTEHMNQTHAGKLYVQFSNAIKSVKPLCAKDLVKHAAEKVGAQLTADEIRAWLVLRNPKAHGTFVKEWGSYAVVQSESYRIDCAFNIAYKLILAAIGYQGPAIDFSVPGWPIRSGDRLYDYD